MWMLLFIVLMGILLLAIIYVGLDGGPRRRKFPEPLVAQLRPRDETEWISVNQAKMNETLMLFSFYRCLRLVDGHKSRTYDAAVYGALDSQIQELESKLVGEKVLAPLDISKLVQPLENPKEEKQ